MNSKEALMRLKAYYVEHGIEAKEELEAIEKDLELLDVLEKIVKNRDESCFAFRGVKFTKVEEEILKEWLENE